MGAILFLGAGFWLGVLYHGDVVEFALDHQPSWMLIKDLDSPHPQTKTAAMSRLSRRYKAGKLSEADQGVVLTTLIDALKKPAVGTWNWDWAELLEDIMIHSPNSPRRNKFWSDGIAVSGSARAKVRRGDPLVVAYHSRPSYNAVRYTIGADCSLECVWIAGQRVQTPELKSGWRDIPNWAFQGGGGVDAIVPIPKEIYERLPDGKQQIELGVRVNGWYREPGPDQNHPLLSELRRVPVGIEVLPPEIRSVQLVTPPEHRQAIVSSIILKEVAVGRVSYDTPDSRLWLKVDLESKSKRLPVHCCWKVVLQSGSKEWTVGSTGEWIHGVDCPIDRFDLETVDVVLQPDPDEAAKTMNVTEIWGEELIFKNVPVRRQR